MDLWAIVILVGGTIAVACAFILYVLITNLTLVLA